VKQPNPFTIMPGEGQFFNFDASEPWERVCNKEQMPTRRPHGHLSRTSAGTWVFVDAFDPGWMLEALPSRA